MADQTKIKTARMKAEQKIYELMDKLDNRKNGYNSSVYKVYFATLSDKQFVEFMNRLSNEEWFNLHYEMNMTDKKDTPDLNRIKKVADAYNIELTEYVAYPFKNPDNPDNPPISESKVPVLYTIVRPLQQLLTKKQAYASDDNSTNLLTGQVTGKSKASTFSNMQTIALSTSNQTDAIKEILGPRSDDEESKAKMMAQIEETGDFDINTIPIRTKDKQALETTRVLLTGAGLRVAFGTDKLSYVLPKD